ncbi:MAG: hypothetical protein FD162_3366 [Rhodobacteraceae bacterium]|nr:MAG: hypothetical protein FD162_3366 [Paracoccaceae bacterium]
MLPALIGAGASLLGGILGRNSERKAIAAQNEYNNPANIRARAEAAGFNPLLFVGPGVGNQMATGGSNYMGSAIADAGLMLSEALAKRQDLRKLDQLKDQNQKLNQQVTDLTIRPKFGGIYSQREAIPSKSAALGGSRGSSVSSVVAADASGRSAAGSVGVSGPDVRPLADSLPVDTRRKVDNQDLKTSAGFMVTDNPNLPFPIYHPTLDGDEALQWYDWPTLALNYAGSAAYDAYQKREKRNAPPPRNPAGVLAGKRPAFPVGYRGKLPNEISLQQAYRMRFGEWGRPHFGPLGKLK